MEYHTKEYYTTIGKNEVGVHAMTWIAIQNLLFGEGRNQVSGPYV